MSPVSAVLLTLAIAAVSVCQIYGWRFAYKSRLQQPIKYLKGKRLLNRVSVVLVLLAAAFLVADHLAIGATVLIGSWLITAYFVDGLAYRKAIVKMSESRNGQTGEYVFTGTPREREEKARLWIDAGGV
jgi:hypothetical protein